MSKHHWLTILGIGEDGLDGVSKASRNALTQAKFIFGAPRHLSLAQLAPPPIDVQSDTYEGDPPIDVQPDPRARAYPIPFSIDPILRHRGEAVVMLVSGDPFWYGAGAVITPHLSAHEWLALPHLSSFSLAASRLGWDLSTTLCIGLHAQPFEILIPQLHHNRQILCLMRDAAACPDFCQFLIQRGFGDSEIYILERLGGPHERARHAPAHQIDSSACPPPITPPVTIGLHVKGHGLPLTPGRDDALFETDGQLTKAPMRALGLSALAPREGERLWDFGAGVGSISIEWLLSAFHTQAIAIDKNPSRIQMLKHNAQNYGVETRLTVIAGDNMTALKTLPPPDAIFIGGGATMALIDKAWAALPRHGRLVMHAVTIQTEQLLAQSIEKYGGEAMRIDISRLTDLGAFQAWRPAYPVMQWCVKKCS